jgi:hypothetical protein
VGSGAAVYDLGVLTPVLMKTSIFRLEEQEPLLLLLPASSWFLAWRILDPEYEGEIFLQNVG